MLYTNKIKYENTGNKKIIINNKNKLNTGQRKVVTLTQS